jgi:predicted nucleic acid-binding protein
MFLIDTNIFLSIILEEESTRNCRTVILRESGNMLITDFALHTIGVKLLGTRRKNPEAFKNFLEKILKIAQVSGLKEKKEYETLIDIAETFNLDFDDAYHTSICKNQKVAIITQDKDFKKVQDVISVVFLNDYINNIEK